MLSKSEGNLCLKPMLSEQFFGNSNILFTGGLLRLSSALVPGFPLSLGLEAEHSGLLGLVVPLSGLLVPSVEGEQLVVAEAFVSLLKGGLDDGGSGVELFLAHECRIFD